MLNFKFKNYAQFSIIRHWFSCYWSWIDYNWSGIGIGLIGANAMTAIARQPDAQPKIFTTMLIIAALVEVIALVGALVALLVLFQ